MNQGKSKYVIPKAIRSALDAWCLAMLLTLGSSSLAQATQIDAEIEALEEEAIRNVVEKLGPSVIRFETIGGTTRVEGTVVSNGPSTGIAISKDGYILSASFNFAHEPASIFARLPDGQRATAEVVGRDLSRKVVLLKIQSNFEFTVPVFANSDEVRVGETIVALGRVFESETPSISTGIVSAKNRIWDRAHQVDAKISPANFGGPLTNLKGEVIGILVPMSPDDDSELAGTEWYDSGIGFAVPLDRLESKFDQLKRGKTLRKGLIGISLKGSDVFADPAVIAFCTGSSPAGKSGLRQDDTIVEINGRKIARQSELKHALGPLYEDDIANVVVQRNAERKSFEVTLAGEIEPFEPPGIGVLIDQDSKKQAVIGHVDPASTAESAGLLPNDQITKFGSKVIASIEDLRLAIASLTIGSNIDIEIVRNNKAAALSLEIGLQTAAPFSKLKLGRAVKTAELVKIKVAEVANQCFAIIPESDETSAQPGLLVWIPQPGKIDEEAIKKTWLEHCRDNNVAVLVPQSTDDKKWSPDDVDFVVSAIKTFEKRFPFNRKQIVVAGRDSGGAMASLVAFGQRTMFKGLALIDASLSQRIRTVATSPVQPLLIFLGTENGLDEKQQASIKRLQQAKFPVHVEESTGRGDTKLWVADLLKWAKTVNRL